MKGKAGQREIQDGREGIVSWSWFWGRPAAASQLCRHTGIPQARHTGYVAGTPNYETFETGIPDTFFCPMNLCFWRKLKSR